MALGIGCLGHADAKVEVNAVLWVVFLLAMIVVTVGSLEATQIEPTFSDPELAFLKIGGFEFEWLAHPRSWILWLYDSRGWRAQLRILKLVCWAVK